MIAQTEPTVSSQLELGPMVYNCLTPRGERQTWQWVCDHVRTKDGAPFNPLDYPWGKGICDAWDDPTIRTIALQTSARIGKTTLASAIMLASLHHDPRPGMIGAPTETLLKEQIKDKYYAMIENCRPMRGWLRPAGRRLQTRMDLAPCIVYGAWAGSTAALSDKDPVYLHGGEIDKWSKNKSDEADPLYLFLERGAEQPDRKVIMESTPSVAGLSRINHWFQNGTGRYFQVPCPKCSFHQRLVQGNGKTGGLIWDKDAEGNATPALAYATARYRCDKCRYEIHDDQRMQAIRRGIWVRRGQHLTRAGKLRGTPASTGPDESFQLGRLYSPTFTFGDVAKEYVASRADVERYRNYVNSWLGEVWVPHVSRHSWDTVAARVCQEYEEGKIPADCVFLTLGVDVQIDHWVYVLVAWNRAQQGKVIEYGSALSWDELTKVIRKPRPHSDDGDPLGPILTLIDARDGNRTDEVLAYCRSRNMSSGPWVWACMGTDSTQMGQRPYRREQLTKTGSKRHSRAGLQDVEVVKVNTSYYQNWISNCIDRREPTEDNSLAFFADAQDDEDLFAQLMNEVADYKDDQSGHSKVRWVVVKKSVPVDLRDATRYARCAADVYLNHNWSRIPAARKLKPVKPEKKVIVPEKAAKSKPKEEPAWLRKQKRSRFIRRS